MLHTKRALLIASIISTTHAFSLNGSNAFWITSTEYSRSPNEYLEYDSWQSNCWYRDDYSMERCVRSHIIEGDMPTSAIWWLIPEEGTSDPQWVHIVAGRDSSWPGYMLGPFDWLGNIYPKPYWWEDDEFASREMVWARYRIEATAVEGNELVLLLTGPESDKADQMLFLNRNIGDWLDTWGPVDVNDRQAMWRLVAVPCSDPAYAGSCELPNFEEAWDHWKASRWTVWAIVVGVFGFFCLCLLLKQRRSRQRLSNIRHTQRSGGTSSAGAATNEMGVVTATPVAATPVVMATAVPVGVTTADVVVTAPEAV